MAHIVIVGDADRGTITHDLPKLQAKLDPASRVLGVPVGLISREEQHVGILRLEVVTDLGAQASRATRVAGHVRDHDLLLVRRITPDHTVKHGLLTVPDAIANILGRIPAFHSEMRIPPGIQHLCLRNLHPSAITLYLKPGESLLIRLQGEELGAHLHHPALLGVDRKSHHLIPGHIHGRWRTASPALSFTLLLSLAVPRCQG